MPPKPRGQVIEKQTGDGRSYALRFRAYVMSQLGHTDPAFTLRVYAHAMRRDEHAKEHLKALVNGIDRAPLGAGTPNGAPTRQPDAPPQNDESPADAGPSSDGHGWFRTSDLSRVKRALSR